MAILTYHNVILAGLLGLAMIAAGRALQARDRASKFRSLGCKPTTVVPTAWWDPFGIVFIREGLESLSRGMFIWGWWAGQDADANRVAGKKVQTYRAMRAGLLEVFTGDPRNVQALLATQFEDYGLETFRAPMRSLLGFGIFNVDGQRWSHFRALLRPAFTREQINDMSIEEKHCAAMMAAIPSPKSNGWTNDVDLEPMFFRQTIDRATEFLFGKSVNSQTLAMTTIQNSKPEDSLAEKFAGSFDFATEYTNQRFFFGDFWWVKNSRKFRSSVNDCHKFIDYYVKLALSDDLQEKIASGRTNEKKYIFLEELVQETRDPDVLRDQLISILLAGRDTSAGTLCYLFKVLAMHPEIMQKLRAAILADFGPYDPNDTSAINFTSLKACTYLQHCLNEILRIYPQVTFNIRQALKDTTLPHGGGSDGESPISVPKGTPVNYCIALMHRDKTTWGDDADEFRPERWQGRKTGWEYIPFNGGPRICIGQQFALTSIGFATVRLLQRFDKLELIGPPPLSPMPIVVNLTSRPMGGVVVRLHEAAKA